MSAQSHTSKRPYEPPRVESEPVPRVPLIQMSSSTGSTGGFVGGGGAFRGNPEKEGEEK